MYINFVFREIVYDDNQISGIFEEWGERDGVSCRFSYDRVTEEITIWDSSRPAAEVKPLPVHWLLYKLKQNGMLHERESKISY